MYNPEFCYHPLKDAGLAEGVVVVIDVLRAFTTAAYALDAGAKRVFPVAAVEEALGLQEVIPKVLTMGEVNGRKPEGFDLSNSPAEVIQVDLTGKSLIQRTTAGTQGIITAQRAEVMLAASFVVADATAEYLRRNKPSLVSFIITGKSYGRDGDEDRACGEYVEALVRGDAPAAETYLARVMSSSVGRSFRSGQLDYLSQEDICMSLRVSRFDFCMPVVTEQGRLFIKKGIE